jgi:dethiobiotin synthetase
VLPETYRFDPPLSPHLAARQAGVEIDPERILADLVRHASADPGRNLLIEGIGGLLVPLTGRGYLLIHLIAESALPVVLVARSTLGTINHTLLSLAALRDRRIEIAGVVMNGPPDRHNREAIESFGKVAVIAEIPPLAEGWDGQGEAKPARSAILAAAKQFDTNRKLIKYFGKEEKPQRAQSGRRGRREEEEKSERE